MIHLSLVLAIGLLVLVLIDWQTRLLWRSASGWRLDRPQIDFRE